MFGKTTTPAPKAPVIPRRSDVLLGRGRNLWGGNRLFDEEIQKRASKYRAAETRYEKTSIVREIIRSVQTWGRFLEQETSDRSAQTPTASDELPSGDWYLASYVKIRKKVGQALRYQMEMSKYESQHHAVHDLNPVQSITIPDMSSSIPDVINFDFSESSVSNGPFNTSFTFNASPLKQITAGKNTTAFGFSQQPPNEEYLSIANDQLADDQSDCNCSICQNNYMGEDDRTNDATDMSNNFDFQLSALLSVEEHEKDTHHYQSPMIVSDAEIFEFLGYQIHRHG